MSLTDVSLLWATVIGASAVSGRIMPLNTSPIATPTDIGRCLTLGIMRNQHRSVCGLSVAFGDQAARKSSEPSCSVLVHSSRVTHYDDVHGLSATDQDIPRPIEGDYLGRADRLDYICLSLHRYAICVDPVKIVGKQLQQRTQQPDVITTENSYNLIFKHLI